VFALRVRLLLLIQILSTSFPFRQDRFKRKGQQIGSLDPFGWILVSSRSHNPQPKLSLFCTINSSLGILKDCSGLAELMRRVQFTTSAAKWLSKFKRLVSSESQARILQQLQTGKQLRTAPPFHPPSAFPLPFTRLSG
jgi:hypothetical protein